jgi:hypothetical protein
MSHRNGSTNPGKPRPVRRCSRCGREAPIFRLRLEDVRRNGWSPPS